MKKQLYRMIGVTAIAAIASVLFLAAADLDVQRLLRGQELLVTMYRLILSNHVEEIPPDELFDAAVKGMLNAIDPYAEFIEERGSTEMDILNRGAYGGLGIKVLTWNHNHYVSYIYDSVRNVTDLRTGDIILQVDSVLLSEHTSNGLRDLLRGTPGTPVRLRVLRPGRNDTITINTIRREIEVYPLTYATRFDDDLAYVKLARFSRSAADSLRTTLITMMNDRPLKGLILDLRDNPGGLLESAVAVMSLFVAQDQPIVSMRGRDLSRERNYFSTGLPVNVDLPLIVLVNKRSASASEIVAGAVQDLDRGVVLGNTTYGKGLVQNILQMNYHTSLKLTTAKYYLPSGRCIQRFQYVGGKAVTVTGSDSVNQRYRTLNLAREVRESTGIVPDMSFSEDSLHGFKRCVQSTHAVFLFISEFLNTHNKQDAFTEAVIQREFIKWLSAKDNCMNSELKKHYSALLQQATEYGVPSGTINTLQSLERKLQTDIGVLVKEHWTWLKRELQLEIASQSSGEHAYIARSLQDDEIVHTAKKLLLNGKQYQVTLQNGPDY